MHEERDSPPSPDLERLLGELRAEVDRRRAAGDYPPGLEEELDHLGRLLGQEPQPGYDRVRLRLEAVSRLAPLSVDRIPSTSRIPGGATLHRLISRLTARQTRGVLQQVQERSDALVEVLVALVESTGRAESHVHADLVGLLDAILDRLADYERAPGEAGRAVVELERRVAALEAAEARRRPPPWPGPSVPLADRALLERHLGEGRPLMDLGGGATAAEGPLAALAVASDASLGGVLAPRVVEGLAPHQVYELVLLARDKLRPGGRLVVEGVNPRSLAGLTEGSRGVPGRDQLVDPEYLRWLCETVGFDETGVVACEAGAALAQAGGPPPVYLVWATR